jgi:hypothetical protein
MSILTKPLFYALAVFLKKWVQMKEAKIKKDIPVKSNGIGRG